MAIEATSRPTRAGLVGLLIGTGVAMIAALGPLVSAITITVGVETQVGAAAPVVLQPMAGHLNGRRRRA